MCDRVSRTFNLSSELSFSAVTTPGVDSLWGWCGEARGGTGVLDDKAVRSTAIYNSRTAITPSSHNRTWH
ncbi:hypothetical protein J6590_027437 [Homalodisca vitripennis]|nr:hypothetical protein J6590_027437 [Homalodisca vitripennis]